MKFFRLTKGKVILTILLGIFTLFSLFMSNAFIHCDSIGGCLTPLQNIFLILFLVLVWPFLFILQIEKLIFTRVDWIHAKDIPFLIIAFILTVLFWYLISCITIYIFKRK